MSLKIFKKKLWLICFLLALTLQIVKLICTEGNNNNAHDYHQRRNCWLQVQCECTYEISVNNFSLVSLLRCDNESYLCYQRILPLHVSQFLLTSSGNKLLNKKRWNDFAIFIQLKVKIIDIQMTSRYRAMMRK